jgi:bifunctional UDP-N-acetylglucosamine pyrophosphorylase/glucosamine-1-phosphate N-acetyltransferase
MSKRPYAVIVLAAGQGKRMNSKLPKVMHLLGGVPLLGHVMSAIKVLDPLHTVVVVGVGKEVTESYLNRAWPKALVVEQLQQRGTGHAVGAALDMLKKASLDKWGDDESVLVVSGDTPLVTPDSLLELLDAQQQPKASAALMTAVVEDPTGYGRIVRDSATNSVIGIVEEVDASDQEKALHEVNGGIYAFEPKALAKALRAISSNNASGEEYLTEVVALLSVEGSKVVAYQSADADLVAGINDRSQLAKAGVKLNQWVTTTWMKKGVTLIDPATTWVEASVELAPDVVIWPNTYLTGKTKIAEGCVIGPDVTLHNSLVGVGARVERSTVRDSKIGEAATVGPYAHLRPGTVVETGVHIGSFVEIKNSSLAVGAKVPHLTYVGDADIGEGTNIGAATVFVNYDGVAKHRTTIGRHVRVGSDTMLVAPVEIGDGAYTAAGSVITEDVPPGAMAVARGRQRNIKGWVKRKRSGTDSAKAAEKVEN